MNVFRWRRQTKNKKAAKIEHVSVLRFAVFRERSTFLHLVIHMIQDHQAREQEPDALGEDKKRK